MFYQFTSDRRKSILTINMINGDAVGNQIKQIHRENSNNR